MATITNAGEILTVTKISDDQQNGNHNSVSHGSKNTYVHYSPSDQKKTVFTPRVLKQGDKGSQKRTKFDIDGIPFDSDDSGSDPYDSDDDENDNGDVHTSLPLSSPLSPSVLSNTILEHRSLHEVAISASFGSKKSQSSALSEATSPINFHNVTINRSLNSGKSPESALSETNLSETTPINLHDVTIGKTFTSKKGRASALSETTPIYFHDPEDDHSISLTSHKNGGGDISEAASTNLHNVTITKTFTSKKSRISALSETTPVCFHDPEDDHSISLTSHSHRSGGTEISETTPIKFHESSAAFNFSFDGSESADSSDTPRSRDSRRNLGMSFAEKKASQRFQSELFDQAIDEDAERDIVNVYLEASAFADRERINLTEDIYSFVLACSYFSIQFWIAIYFILVKYLCYGVIFFNLTKESYTGEGDDQWVLATKFIMIPVAVAMQEDLITVYYNVANKHYDALTYKGNIYATEFKWILCNLLRVVDGLLSLAVNFGVMLLNDNLLNIFLSFAALHFLQFIDDVIYELAEKGFFGHSMEQATIACKIITFTRRTTTGDACNNMITNLDTTLLFTSIGLCYLIYILFIVVFYAEDDNTFMSEISADIP